MMNTGEPNGEDDDAFIMISALQHYLYCPRQCALIHVEQVFEENVFTRRGQVVHERVDQPNSSCGKAKRIVRGLPLLSRHLHIVGRADVVEFYEIGVVIPVEYKSGNQAGALHDRVQLTAQALCLEEMFKVDIPEGVIYWAGTKTRETISLDAALRTTTIEIIGKVRSLIAEARVPAAVYDRRCTNCSLIDICQPEMLVTINQSMTFARNLFNPDG